MFREIFLIFSCVSLLTIKCDANESKWRASSIVPDVISTDPSETASVTYENNIIVDGGNELKPRDVKNIPQIKWNADEDKYYTLAMVDPDAPSRTEPKFREVNSFLL